jgi:hypothetical protein
MRELLQLALLAAQAVAASKPQPPQERPYVVVTCVVGITLCMLVAEGFLVTAIWLFLLPVLGSAFTALALAGIVLVKAGLIAVWLRLKPSRATPHATAPAMHPLALLPPVLEEAGRMFNAHKAPSLMAAMLIGLVVAARQK